MTQRCTLAVLSLLCFIFSCASGRRTTSPNKVPKNAVLLSKISSLTLRDGKLTSSRRVDPVPQLSCVGPGDVCSLYKVDVMRCKNEGADYEEEDIQWACKASLPEDFKLGSTEVICEGYESSDDPYVLKGSCAVEYRLLLTDKGEARYQAYLAARNSALPPLAFSRRQASSRSATILFAVVFLGVLFLILRGFWRSIVSGPPRRPGYRSNGGGGDDDPPPPYDGPPSYSDAKKHTASQSQRAARSSTTNASSSRSFTTRGQTGQNSWRPGFWSGALAGAGAGYAASRMQSRQSSRQPQMSEREPSSSSFVPSPSTERHESTGFGGTRRR